MIPSSNYFKFTFFFHLILTFILAISYLINRNFYSIVIFIYIASLYYHIAFTMWLFLITYF